MENKIKNSIMVLKGNNISRLINNFVNANIEINNAKRIDAQTLEFDVDDNNLKKIQMLNLKNYELTYKTIGGKKRLKSVLINRSGLIIGIILSIIAIFLLNNRILNIKITGLQKYTKEEVCNEINNFGLGYLSLMNDDLEKLEMHLSNSFDFSFVSIISKGNSLIINVKEEISDIKDEYIPITSDYNMVVTGINVYAGYSTIKIGDVVYKGDVLVYPYEIINNEEVSVLPMAEIYGDAFFSARYNFRNEEIVYERTGNSKVIENTYYLGKYKLLDKNIDNTFDSYEKEYLSKNISYYFLPITINQMVVYETKEVLKKRIFEDEKDEIIQKLKKEVYLQVPDNFKVDSEDIQIYSTNYGNIVTIYIKSSVYLRYK